MVGQGPVEWETGANPNWGNSKGSGAWSGDGDMATSGAPAPMAAEGGDSEGGGGTTTGGNGDVQPGTLTAGSFDDHLNPGAFDTYWKHAGQLSQEAPDLSERALISVRDGAGGPINQAQVTVSSGVSKEVLSRVNV